MSPYTCEMLCMNESELRCISILQAHSAALALPAVRSDG